ncbi:unnamed protein product [Rotaria sordida]|uniref:Uncharacterized protein n=1 Tax=Rotaria sordida TaxID=392033 RepID=A0A813XY63_9BILA|nr:unnamed protein product [Rotaria sordida]
MKTYNFRINQPKQGDQYFKNPHFEKYSNDAYTSAKVTTCSQKTRWLRGIVPHIQQFIFRATSDRAKGEKRVGKISLSNTTVVTALEKIGINKKWAACPPLLELLNFNTCFIKGNYIYKAIRLEFKQVEKIVYYFDHENNARQTGVANFLYLRLLKETSRAITIN